MPGKGLAPYGLRYAGQGVKGQGYYGQLPYTGVSEETNYELHPGVATELSSEDEEIGHYPLIVPGLSKEELDLLLSGKEPTENIQKIAREHAISRKQKRKNPFALPTELKYPLPEKAKGGPISPIKTPREMLFQMAGIPTLADGGVTPSPREMQAMLVAYGKMPPSFENIAAHAAKAKPRAPFLKKLGTRALQGLGVASVPLSAMATQEYLSEGDYPGAVLSGLETLSNAASMYPPLSLPATALGFGAAGANMAREYLKPEYRSVMEDYK